MTKIIFERETEIGKCDSELTDGHSFRYAEPDLATVYAHTQASVNGNHGMLKIEQHCFLRHGEDIPDQPWVRPEIVLEPALESRKAMIDLARMMHEQFVERARKEIPDQFLV
jgi:hypothetical protein